MCSDAHSITLIIITHFTRLTGIVEFVGVKNDTVSGVQTHKCNCDRTVEVEICIIAFIHKWLKTKYIIISS